MLSKPFAIATEGPTIDGRVISRDWITQMAASYDPKVYTAVANLEHYLSSVPDSIFGAYGKVVSLSTREVELMGDKKLQLLAIVDANEKLVALQKAGQKGFCSMEVINNFIGKGIAYLSGLAFLNTPASIGTESMKFSLSGAPGERFAFAQEVAIEFEAEESTNPSAGDSLFAKVKEILGIGKKETADQFAEAGKAIEVIALSQKDLLENFASLEQQIADLVVTGKATAEAVDKQVAEFTALKEVLDKTPDGTPNRRPATGGNGQVATDC